ncbi:hypothetical protein AWH48_08025 [Domibacillus aminovorans]|uniref:3-hydroxyacyl-CoA dehydrogenase C-terminal domain-containing protein n=2 Tax=Bacillales TaxID=1385 RepID=A0A177KMD3_9BACI|nr:hypothetical protein AWH48_08025 [Domibacillus aminovorans]
MHIAQKELAKDIHATGDQKVFIATDKGLLKADVVDGVTTVLEKEGLDYIVFSDLYEDLENRTTPSPLLEENVRNGALGVKSKQGFFNWEEKNMSAIQLRKNIELLELARWLEKREHDKPE